jgi:hypothetical protein
MNDNAIIRVEIGQKMPSSRNARPSSHGRTVEQWLLEALDDMRHAAALLRAAESRLSSHLKTPAAGIRDCGKEPVRLRAAAGILRLAAVEEKQTRRKQSKLAGRQ